MPIIQAFNLSRTFGKLTAVDDLSFEVNEGEVPGFLGTNGAGKTTTASFFHPLWCRLSGLMDCEGAAILSPSNE